MKGIGIEAVVSEVWKDVESVILPQAVELKLFGLGFIC